MQLVWTDGSQMFNGNSWDMHYQLESFWICSWACPVRVKMALWMLWRGKIERWACLWSECARWERPHWMSGRLLVPCAITKITHCHKLSHVPPRWFWFCNGKTVSIIYTRVLWNKVARWDSVRVDQEEEKPKGEKFILTAPTPKLTIGSGKHLAAKGRQFANTSVVSSNWQTNMKCNIFLYILHHDGYLI